MKKTQDAGLPPIDFSNAPVEGKTDRRAVADSSTLAVDVVPDVADSDAGIVLNAGSLPSSIESSSIGAELTFVESLVGGNDVDGIASDCASARVSVSPLSSVVSVSSSSVPSLLPLPFLLCPLHSHLPLLCPLCQHVLTLLSRTRKQHQSSRLRYLPTPNL